MHAGRGRRGRLKRYDDRGHKLQFGKLQLQVSTGCFGRTGLIEVKVFKFLVVSRILCLVVAAGLMASTVVPAFSQAKATGDADVKKEEASVPVPAETSSVTKHEWAAGGRMVHYTATAGNRVHFLRKADELPNRLQRNGGAPCDDAERRMDRGIRDRAPSLGPCSGASRYWGAS